MTASSGGTTSTEAASLLLDALVEAGVREVVLCPGSRSSPLAYAAWSAERQGRLRLHVRVDERTAGFLALGLAKVSRRPAVVITTSGTAVANLHPAVLEAHHALVPLIVLSADRPAELRGTGASQTTIQPGMFGIFCRDEIDLAPGSALTEVAAQARAAVAAATGRTEPTAGRSPSGGRAGPVHVNVQFAEPLVPASLGASGVGAPALAPTHAGRASPADVASPVDVGTPADAASPLSPTSSASPTSPTGPTSSGAVGHGSVGHGSVGDGSVGHGSVGDGWVGHESGGYGSGGYGSGGHGSVGQDGPDPVDGPTDGPRPDLPARTLVVLGDLPTSAEAGRVLAWARAHRLPVVAEPFGPHPRPGVVRHGVLVLGATGFVDRHEPEAIVVAGRPTLSRPVSRLLRRPGPDLVSVAARQEFAVPGRHLRSLALSDLEAATVAVGPPAWFDSWLAAGERVGERIDAEPPAAGTGTGVARALAASLPEDALLFLGSSSIPRDVDLAATVEARVDVVASRGLAGIDGCVSTAIGLALAAPERPTYAVLGDLTFLHDANGLLIGPDEPRPDLTIVVVNDDGGGIFATLEPGAQELAPAFERLFGTPTGTDLEALCRAHGIRHVLAGSRAQLSDEVTASPRGLRVVEYRVDRSTHRPERERLRALAAAALGK